MNAAATTGGPGAAPGVGKVGAAARHTRLHDGADSGVCYMNNKGGGGRHGSSKFVMGKLSDSEWKLRHDMDSISDRY